jgi:L-2-hydroxyglutarate oxidase LhgO
MTVGESSTEINAKNLFWVGQFSLPIYNLSFLSADEVRELEPEVEYGGGLLSPSTGIIDSHELMMALQGEIEANRGAVVLNSKVTDLSVDDQGLRLESGGEAFVCETLINSAGLWAQDVASGGDRAHEGISPAWRAPTIWYAKGHYFAYQGKSPFRRLVYPMPSDGGLGIHATNDMGGAARFGPDVEWVDATNYDFDESRKPDFVAAIQTYFPGLDEEKLGPAYTGICPKLSGPGEPAADFVIQGEADHGVRGLVNLFGIESPGLTACLAMGEYVEAMLGSQNRGRSRSHKSRAGYVP